MQNRMIAPKILAVLGTVLTWLPLLAPAVFGLIRLVTGGGFSFDYLMPAELFPVALAGCLMLVATALLARLYRNLTIIALGVALAALQGGIVLAQASGLASGATQPQGTWWALVVGLFVLYMLALAAEGIGGILLLRRLLGGRQPVRRPAA